MQFKNIKEKVFDNQSSDLESLSKINMFKMVMKDPNSEQKEERKSGFSNSKKRRRKV